MEFVDCFMVETEEIVVGSQETIQQFHIGSSTSEGDNGDTPPQPQETTVPDSWPTPQRRSGRSGGLSMRQTDGMRRRNARAEARDLTPDVSGQSGASSGPTPVGTPDRRDNTVAP